MGELNERVALVTGAATGIGRQIAVDLAQQGAKVIITGRQKQSLVACSNLHPNISYLHLDVSNPEDVLTLVENVTSHFKRLDLLVHNAGMAPVTPLTNQTLEEFDQVFTVNVRAVLHLTQQCLPLLTAARGNIIAISSAVASKPLANMSVYSASKAALKSLTMAWAKEFAPNIRVNSVSVGPIETPIYEKTVLTADEVAAHKQKVTAQIPLGKFGTPRDISSLVVFLASERASFITGADLAVDGGFAI